MIDMFTGGGGGEEGMLLINENCISQNYPGGRPNWSAVNGVVSLYA